MTNEDKNFIESLSEEEKKYWVFPVKERPKYDNNGIFYNSLPKRFIIFCLSKFFPNKFNKFDL